MFLDWDGGLTLLAPVVAIALALLTKRVLPSLGAAVLVGAWVAARGAPMATVQVLWQRASGVIMDLDNLTVSAFSMLVAATVGVMTASGGMAALVRRIERIAHGRRGAMTATAAAGGAVFFDDYANCLVVGSAMGPLCDRHGVSRAKLAYLVDATAAPLASLAVVSTWVGYEVSLFDSALSQADTGIAAFPLFLQALPYRFYCLLTLCFVFAIAITGRDFGPMRTVEERVVAPPARTSVPPTDPPGGPWLAAVPVAILVLVTFGLLVSDGWNALGPDAPSAALFEIVGAGNAFRAMLWGSVAAWTAAAGMSVVGGALTLVAVPAASWDTVRTVLSALAVLYLAWTLGGLIKDTGAAAFLAGTLEGRVSAAWLPAVVFVTAALTSFSTGSSFFTMGALIPLVVPLAIELDGPTVGPVLLASAAAVLDGSVLGDHASPISDTTILSSLGAQVDVVTHVRTQLPYVLVVGAVALLTCVIPAGFGVPVGGLVFVGGLACIAIVRSVGRVPA